MADQKPDLEAARKERIELDDEFSQAAIEDTIKSQRRRTMAMIQFR